uniref:Voltage-dependent calcium channel subunit alpha-2/delta-1 n=1 Tax=Cryptocotyle lingua TaxID=66766 RepID=A0A7U0YEH4_9TREM|nr:voltage-dependent calcium channel subunit alpha-2/delta-1 [Cryptocotyle lingua]
MQRNEWILLLYLCAHVAAQNPGSLEKDFITWANELEKSFSELQTLTGENILHNVYRGPNFGKREMTEEAAFELLDKAAQKVQIIVKEKADLVHKIKLAAEEAYRTRTHREPTGCYLRAKAITLTPSLLTPNFTQNCSEKLFLDMERNALFGNTYVSLNYSTAHVPTNVYDLSKTLVSVGNWTGTLDRVFQENAAADPTLKWQYFGSSTGFFRFYPGSMWDIQLDELRLDFFDCRSQPWYLSASSYAKEMIILVDKSGSMKGRSDIISNATVTEILNTLTENDFFNIIMFTDTPRYADPAIQDRLIQAYKYNKDRMVRKFQDFTPNGTASYERALTEAYGLLNKTRENHDTAKHCSQMLMIITDSVPDSYKELLEKLDPDKNVRIFVYLLGQHSPAEPYVKELACITRGYTVTIATLTDVKENVLKYLNVVARSNALLNYGFITWSGVLVQQFNLRKLTPDNFTTHFTANIKLRMKGQPIVDAESQIKREEPKIDTMIASKEEEPVLYTSVAEAVYDRTKKAMRLKQGNLLGVAGIDVPLQSFRDALRGWEVGVNNYLFAVDNNGFVLFHPGYRPVYKSTVKSYYQNVDLNEVEVPQDVKIDPNTGTPNYDTPLRQTMIERERKVNELETQIITDNFHTMFQANMKYFSTPIEQTPFTLGLAVWWNNETGRGYPIPEFTGASAVEKEQFKRTEMDAFAPIYAEENGNECSALHNYTNQGATLSPYQFCQFDKELAALWQLNPICVLRRILLDGDLQNRMKCDTDYLARIRLDARETQILQKFWTQIASSPLISKWGIQQAFSFHHSGFIRFHNFSSPVYPNFIKDHIFGVEDPLYAETVLTNQYFQSQKLAVFHPPPNDLFRHFSSQQLDVPIPMTMTIYNERHQVPMAVVGLQITHQQLQKQFNQMTNSCVTEQCKSCGTEDVDCYLINQAALVLASSGGEKEIGQSLKEINCALVEHMVNVSVLRQYYLYDFQGICIEVNHGAQSLGSRLLAPFYSIVKLLVRSIHELILVFIGFIQPLNPLPIFGQDWNLYRGSRPGEGHLTSNNIYKEPLQSDNRLPNFQFPDQSHGMYMGSVQTEPYRYGTDRSAQKDRTTGDYLQNKPQSSFYGEESETQETDFSIPPLPSLENDEADIITGNTTESTTGSQTSASEELELEEESNDEIMGIMDQDPYEAQLRALNAIEACRQQQLVIEQRHFELEHGSNLTDGTSTNKTDRPLVPGSLLDCIHKSVQQRCRSSAGTSSLTGRYACEAVCAIVRERMPQLAGKIDDCRQPLTACTERFVAFQVAARWANPSQVSSTVGQPDQAQTNQDLPKEYVASGEYCQECGTRRWHLKPIKGTNLFFLVDYAVSGASSLSCKCNCKKRFRYGAQIKVDPMKPMPIRQRRDPPSPETCTIIKASMENSSVCTDKAKSMRQPWNLLLFVTTLQLLLKL